MNDGLIAWVDSSGVVHVDDPKDKGKTDPARRTQDNLKLILQQVEALTAARINE